MKKLKLAKSGYILISIAFYITGLFCIFFPGTITENAEITAAIILIAYGIVKIIGYFSGDLYCLAFQYDFACGIFLMTLGVVMLCLRNRVDSAYFLTPLGVLILLDSLLCVQTSLDARKFGMSEWKTILLFSAVSGVFGVLLIVRDTIMIAGFALLAEGAMRHYIVHCTVYIPDVKRNADDK